MIEERHANTLSVGASSNDHKEAQNRCKQKVGFSHGGVGFGQKNRILSFRVGSAAKTSQKGRIWSFFPIFAIYLFVTKTGSIGGGLGAGLVAVFTIILLVLLCRSPKAWTLGIGFSFSDFKLQTRARITDFSLKEPKTLDDPHKLVIVAVVDETVLKPLPETTGGSSEHTPLISDRTPSSSEDTYGLPAYYAV